jgi:3-hydroxyisobutyrate dehydrogenase
MKVGFVGLGLMGNPMAKNILKAGFDLSVYNRSKNKTVELRKLGAHVYDTVQEMAKNVDVIITMVTGPKDVKEVVFGKKGVVAAGKRGLTIIDMSTIGPEAAVEIADKLKKHAINFIDAPVTGSVPRAITGDLTIFIGASKQSFEQIKPVLFAMGKNLRHIGENGAGQAIKLVNNHLVAATVTSLAEAMLLADTLKISRKKLADALSETPAFSAFMKLKLPNFVKNNFPTAFSIANMHKDLALAEHEVKKVKKRLPVLSMVRGFFKKALDMKLGDQDISAVIKTVKK